MQVYRFENGLQPAGSQPPAVWDSMLAVLEPGEAADAGLPPLLVPPQFPVKTHESQFCWLQAGAERITGHIRIPLRHSQPARRFTFVWAQGCLILSDDSRCLPGCIDEIRRMRPHCADGADNFLADLFITLLRDDLHDIQQLETRLTDLEQAVLSDGTDGFLKQMSAIRKQLHRNNRFYAQLSDFASSLLEEAADLFDRHSTRRWNYFLRKVEHLRDETRLLHEYASQISSEYQAQVDIMQNQVMKLLTIVTTIFLPLSLLAGWYGMNFDSMPELRWAWGYPVLIAAAVVIVLALIHFFKRRKWL